MPTVEVRRASSADLPAMAELFDGYRQFYGQAPDRGLAESFLRDRFANDDSVVFLASDSRSGESLGFVQLYSSFSSVAAQRIWILNDLFVAPTARSAGVGRALLEAAREHAVETGAKRITLSSAVTNRKAQQLYESHGYTKDDEFLTYHLEL